MNNNLGAQLCSVRRAEPGPRQLPCFVLNCFEQHVPERLVDLLSLVRQPLRVSNEENIGHVLKQCVVAAMPGFDLSDGQPNTDNEYARLINLSPLTLVTRAGQGAEQDEETHWLTDAHKLHVLLMAFLHPDWAPKLQERGANKEWVTSSKPSVLRLFALSMGKAAFEAFLPTCARLLSTGDHQRWGVMLSTERLAWFAPDVDLWSFLRGSSSKDAAAAAYFKDDLYSWLGEINLAPIVHLGDVPGALTVLAYLYFRACCRDNCRIRAAFQDGLWPLFRAALNPAFQCMHPPSPAAAAAAEYQQLLGAQFEEVRFVIRCARTLLYWLVHPPMTRSLRLQMNLPELAQCVAAFRSPRTWSPPLGREEDGFTALQYLKYESLSLDQAHWLLTFHMQYAAATTVHRLAQTPHHVPYQCHRLYGVVPAQVWPAFRAVGYSSDVTVKEAHSPLGIHYRVDPEDCGVLGLYHLTDPDSCEPTTLVVCSAEVWQMVLYVGWAAAMAQENSRTLLFSASVIAAWTHHHCSAPVLQGLLRLFFMGLYSPAPGLKGHASFWTTLSGETEDEKNTWIPEGLELLYQFQQLYGTHPDPEQFALWSDLRVLDVFARVLFRGDGMAAPADVWLGWYNALQTLSEVHFFSESKAMAPEIYDRDKQALTPPAAREFVRLICTRTELLPLRETLYEVLYGFMPHPRYSKAKVRDHFFEVLSGYCYSAPVAAAAAAAAPVSWDQPVLGEYGAPSVPLRWMAQFIVQLELLVREVCWVEHLKDAEQPVLRDLFNTRDELPIGQYSPPDTGGVYLPYYPAESKTRNILLLPTTTTTTATKDERISERLAGVLLSTTMSVTLEYLSRKSLDNLPHPDQQEDPVVLLFDGNSPAGMIVDLGYKYEKEGKVVAMASLPLPLSPAYEALKSPMYAPESPPRASASGFCELDSD